MTEKDEQSHIAEINRLHGELQHLATDALGQAIRIGELLCSVKAKLGHGKWLRWTQSNVAFSERTARNYIRVFQERDRLKSANVADLTRAYLALEKPSTKSKEQSAENGAHSGFLDNVRQDLECPKSPDIEELKRVYQARLSSMGELREHFPYWTLTEIQEDPNLLQAFEMVYAAYGFDGAIMFLSGRNGFDRNDVIYLASLGMPKMLELGMMVMNKVWRAKFCIDFFDEAPTKNSTIDEMQDRCLASKEKRVTATIDGFFHVCELELSFRFWWNAGCYPGYLSKIPTRFSSIDEVHATCAATDEKCLCFYLGSFNHRCELLRDGSEIDQSVFPAFYKGKLQEFICGRTQSGEIQMTRCRPPQLHAHGLR